MENENIKKIIYGVLVVIAVLVGYFIFFEDKDEKNSVEEANQEILKTEEQVIAEFSAKYNAVNDWAEGILYTFQIQEKLLTEKPAIFTGYVDDIYRKEDKLFVVFSSGYIGEDFFLELECSQEIVNKIMAKSGRDPFAFIFESQVMVAKINEVKKPKIAIEAFEGGDTEYDDVEIELSNSYAFLGKGVCVDFEVAEENDE